MREWWLRIKCRVLLSIDRGLVWIVDHSKLWNDFERARYHKELSKMEAEYNEWFRKTRS